MLPKYICTGHTHTTKWEWLVNQHQDSSCSNMSHFDLLNYVTMSENERRRRCCSPAGHLRASWRRTEESAFWSSPSASNGLILLVPASGSFCMGCLT
ncbi:hypothetical protein U0070_012250 [Myodes glareolus]|uniref:Uncharacterized protein n=1 Tax=Myodes glareolus TaxID=447135 RepID=A0AAW0JF25_MYOGA